MKAILTLSLFALTLSSCSQYYHQCCQQERLDAATKYINELEQTIEEQVGPVNDVMGGDGYTEYYSK